jgi:hypothetical protein
VPNVRTPTASPPTTENTFRTPSTSFAAALVAANALEYSHPEMGATGVVFVFHDPATQGDLLRRRFDAGMFPRVDARVLFSARGFLIDEMARLSGKGKHRGSKT